MPVVERLVEVATENREILIGRHREVTLELPFPAVSGRHARLFRDEGGYRIEDLGSANGTSLGGRRLSPHVSESIAVGETIGIAGVDILFEGDHPDAGPNSVPESTATLARRLVHDIFDAYPPAECARLEVLGGPAQGRVLVLAASGRVFLLGRGAHCDLALPDDDVSREHAAFERSAKGVLVRDLESKNGVEVQGQRLTGPRHLRDGEIVRIGETRLRVADPEDRYLRQMEEADAKLKEDLSASSPAQVLTSPTPESVAAPAILPGAATPNLSQRSHIPAIVAVIATTVLLSVLGLVLALVFGAWK